MLCRSCAGHSVGMVAPTSLYLGGFLSGDSVFLLIWDVSGILLTKDDFLQLIRDPSGVARYVGWLAENGSFSC